MGGSQSLGADVTDASDASADAKEVDDVTDDIHEGQRSAWSARQRLEARTRSVEAAPFCGAV